VVADSQDTGSRLSSRPTNISLSRRGELRASPWRGAEATSTAWAWWDRSRTGAGSEWGESASVRGGAVHNHAR